MCGVAELLPSTRSRSMANGRPFPRFRFGNRPGVGLSRDLESVMTHPDAGGRMIALFHDAGLKQPTMLCEIPVAGGPDSPIYAWMALTLRSLLPQVEKIGAATAAEIDIDTL